MDHLQTNAHMIQGSHAWHAWRSNRIGSSDAPIVMGVSPWMTPYQLWQQKTKRKTFDHSSYVTDKGTEIEPLARAIYCMEYDVEMPPMVFDCELEGLSFMSASMDGFNLELRKGLEIKCPGKQVFEMAQRGQIPDHYIWQLEHQMIVAEATEIDFFVVQGERRGVGWAVTDQALVTYKSDPAKRKLLIEKEKEFWKMVTQDVPPALTDKDVLERTEPEALMLFVEMKAILEKIKAADDLRLSYDLEKERLKNLLITQMKHTKEEAYGVRITQNRSKRIDEALMKASGLDVEPFKKETISYQVRLVK